VEIAFDSRLTVLVGPNGSGKSSVLRAIHFLGNQFRGQQQLVAALGPAAEVGEANRTFSGKPGEPQAIEITLRHASSDDIVSRYEALLPSINNGPQPHKASFRVSRIKDGDGSEQITPQSAGKFSTSLLQFSKDRLAAPSFVSKPNPTVAHDGFGLPSALAYFGPEPPSVLLLDDLDHGLHPKGQMHLVDFFHSLLQSEEFSESQIIATSHSPYVLNQLMPNEVRVMALRDDGSSICVPLSEHPEFDRWKDAMTPGEFWSHLGDDWVKKLPAYQSAQ
jgi:predicted ATPase